MNGNVWITFLALVAILLIGYEIGKATTMKKINDLLKQLGDMLKNAADKIKQDQEDMEKQRIERAAKMDELRDEFYKVVSMSVTKEGEPIESNKNS